MTINPQAVPRERDPVCGMGVRLDAAIEDGLVAQHDHHSYYFCRAACRDEFLASPAAFITSHGQATERAHLGSLEIDDGMRRWYDSCSCCLSDAYPEVKAALDQERASKALPMADPGICEIAEAPGAPGAE